MLGCSLKSAYIGSVQSVRRRGGTVECHGTYRSMLLSSTCIMRDSSPKSVQKKFWRLVTQIMNTFSMQSPCGTHGSSLRTQLAYLTPTPPCRLPTAHLQWSRPSCSQPPSVLLHGPQHLVQHPSPPSVSFPLLCQRPPPHCPASEFNQPQCMAQPDQCSFTR